MSLIFLDDNACEVTTMLNSRHGKFRMLNRYILLELFITAIQTVGNGDAF